MKLDDIVSKVATDSGLNRADVKKSVSGVFAAIKSAVDAGSKINIPGMGSFQLKEREAGQRVAKSGETRDVGSARFLIFKATRAAMGLPPKERKSKKGKAAAPKKTA